MNCVFIVFSSNWGGCPPRPHPAPQTRPPEVPEGLCPWSSPSNTENTQILSRFWNPPNRPKAPLFQLIYSGADQSNTRRIYVGKNWTLKTRQDPSRPKTKDAKMCFGCSKPIRQGPMVIKRWWLQIVSERWPANLITTFSCKKGCD